MIATSVKETMRPRVCVRWWPPATHGVAGAPTRQEQHAGSL